MKAGKYVIVYKGGINILNIQIWNSYLGVY
jgi:hypothetical protein